jgi:hypothetical protein
MSVICNFIPVISIEGVIKKQWSYFCKFVGGKISLETEFKVMKSELTSSLV